MDTSMPKAKMKNAPAVFAKPGIQNDYFIRNL